MTKAEKMAEEWASKYLDENGDNRALFDVMLDLIYHVADKTRHECILLMKDFDKILRYTHWEYEEN